VPAGDRDYALTVGIPVPTRDGVELLTDLYAPVGGSRGTILVRTPYGRTGPVAFLTARLYALHGYRVVHQSCRGTDGSGGTLEPFQHEIADGADTVAWLRRQPWFDGRFALCGPSYLGYAAWAVMVDPPPELATAVIGVTGHDNYQLTHGSGTLGLEQLLRLMHAFAHLHDGMVTGLLRMLASEPRFARACRELPLVRAVDTVLAGTGMPYRSWLTTRDAGAPFWQPLRVTRALEESTAPVLLQGGWQDRFPDQMIEQYTRLRRRGVEVGLTIGPWRHVEFSYQAAGQVAAESLAWLAGHLSGSSPEPRAAPVRVSVTGSGEWLDLPDWPPSVEEQVLFLHADGGLDSARPSSDGRSGFVYDPTDPTPAVGGRVLPPTPSGQRDNRALERRSDVLSFTTPALPEPRLVVGNPRVELVHHTDNPQADLFVRLCDVDPTGRSTNVSDGFRRLDPNTADGVVAIRLEALAHRFRPGHRIRLLVCGGAHPRYARHLGTPEDPTTSSRLAPSRRTIEHRADGATRLLLPTLSD
jgi:putative CocE/NonD family hydrolase